MPQYKVLIGFGTTPVGSTEAYITREVSAGEAPILVQDLLNNRAAFLPVDILFAGVRISNVALKRSSRLLLPGPAKWPDKNGVLTVPAKGTYTSGASLSQAIPYTNALQIRVGYGGDGRFTAKYLVGVPRHAVELEPGNLNQGTPIDWWTPVNQFLTFIETHQFFLRARRQDGEWAPIAVKSLLPEAGAPGLLQLVVTGASVANLKVGERISVTGFVNKKTYVGTFNGTWTVASINDALPAGDVGVALRDTASIDSGQFKKLGTMQRFAYNLALINTFEAQRIAAHQRGGPFTQPRGRQKTRLLLDP